MHLSGREREILEAVARGETSKSIGAALGIRESTVNWHLANVFAKLGAASRAEAVATALQQGLIGGGGAVPEPARVAAPARRRRSIAPLLRRQLAIAVLLLMVVVFGPSLADAATRAARLEPAPSPEATAAPATARPAMTAAPTGEPSPRSEASPRAP